jgi:rhodanese-related sulfurtransferase
VEFIINNAIFVVLASVSGLALIWPAITSSNAGISAISVSEAVLLMNRARLFILDVRDEAEFAEGHIQGAKHMPLAKLDERIQELAKQKTKAVLVVCQRGMRSNTACKILTSNQFTQVYGLQGGLDKWIEAKMPLVKDE